MNTTSCLCFLDKPRPLGKPGRGSVCVRLLAVLAWLGMAGCTDDAGYGQEEANGIGISGTVATRATDYSDEPKPLTEAYGVIHIHHTRNNGSFSQGVYKDAGADMNFKPSGGMLNPEMSDGGDVMDYRWYWDGAQKHLFHAWTEPDDGEVQGEGESIVGTDGDTRLRWVDLSMKKTYEHYEGDSVKHRLSNLEYFIGTVKGPVNMQENGGTVALEFKHLVAKIVVLDVVHVKHDRTTVYLTDDQVVSFDMPNMPKKAYWTTGVPEGDVSLDGYSAEEPRLYDLTDNVGGKEIYQGYGPESYGVDGSLHKNTCFYIYPCKFADKNTEGNELGEIEFQFDGVWYYGTLASLTGVPELKAGDCISLTLLLKDGDVSGLHPYIADWNKVEKTVPSRDRKGIYDMTDWQRYIDWILECQEAESNGTPKPEPPAGLFDDEGNLNLYCDLDLRGVDNKYARLPDVKELLFPEGGGQLKGNGHRIKVNDGTSWKSGITDKLDDVYVGKTGY